jgi:hypothetical protein
VPFQALPGMSRQGSFCSRPSSASLLGGAPSDARTGGNDLRTVRMRAEPFVKLRTALVEACGRALRQAQGT